MTLSSDCPLADPGRAYNTRLFIAQKLSGLHGQSPSYIRGDIANIRTAVSLVAEGRAATWDPFYACDEVPPPADGTDDPAIDLTITRRNNEAADLSDGLVVHGGQNGSTFLGHLQRNFLQGPLPRPVAVVVHEDDREMSRAWAGLEHEHPLLEILRFGDDDLAIVLSDWLRRHADELDRNAELRRGLDDQWQPICLALTRALDREADADRERIAGRVGLTGAGLRLVAARAMGVAGLPAQHLLLLQGRYGEVMERGMTWAAARELLLPAEREVWREWYGQVGDDRAWRTLRHEIVQRQLEGVWKPRPRLLTIQLWNVVERQVRDA